MLKSRSPSPRSTIWHDSTACRILASRSSRRIERPPAARPGALPQEIPGPPTGTPGARTARASLASGGEHQTPEADPPLTPIARDDPPGIAGHRRSSPIFRLPGRRPARIRIGSGPRGNGGCAPPRGPSGVLDSANASEQAALVECEGTATASEGLAAASTASEGLAAAAHHAHEERHHEQAHDGRHAAVLAGARGAAAEGGATAVGAVMRAATATTVQRGEELAAAASAAWRMRCGGLHRLRIGSNSTHLTITSTHEMSPLGPSRLNPDEARTNLCSKCNILPTDVTGMRTNC